MVWLVLNLLTQLIRHAPIIAYAKDLQGRYLLVSEAWLEAFQTTHAAVAGRTDHELFAKEKADDFAKNDQAVLQSRVPSRRFEDVLVPPEVRTFYSVKFPVIGSDGVLVGLAGFSVDVTEQHSVVKELERQKRFLERTQAMTDVGGWEFDSVTRTFVWTSETFRIAGMSEREGAPLLDDFIARFALEHRDAVKRAFDDGLAHATPFRLEVDLERPGGKRRRVLIHGIPEGEPRRLSGALQDVTDERQMEERLRHASRMDAVGQLAGGMAHDFNNMLGAISAAAELLGLEDHLSEGGREAVHTILTASGQAATLTRQLLQFSRKQPSTREPIDLHAVLDESLVILQRTLDKRIELLVEKGASQTRLLGDSAQLLNALINLALNARDAMPDGGRLVFRTSDDRAGLVRLDVIDTGVGIPVELQGQIFDPFFTTKERGRGTGLGLASVDAAVRGHDGSITVHSEPGKGTTFSLRFPVRAVELVPVEPPRRRLEGRIDATVLLIDDEALVRRSMARLLAELGLTVLDAGDGAKGLEVWQAANPKPRLVILDLMMPGLSARDTFLALRQLSPELPVLFCSGFAPEALMAELLAFSRTARLGKPFAGAELERLVRELLA